MTSHDPHEPQPLDLLRDELIALDARSLLPINLDIPSAAMVVIGAASEIREHRADIVALVGEEMVCSIDRLELVARAAVEAHARHLAIESGADLAPLFARVGERRELLRSEVRTLVARRLLPAGVASELTQGQGYRNVSFDVLQLVAALRQAWDGVRHKTGLTLDELVEAEAAANALMTAVGLRDQGGRSPSADMRQRAFTLLARTYNEARRVVSFLRWNEGDADRIAPSLFHGRNRRRGRPPTTATEMPAHTELPLPATPTVGMPGGSPFVPDDATAPTLR